jgi:beta-galactosidase GanA
LSERDLLRGDFKGAKIVVVPDARCVSEKTFAELASFAKRGGIVIADGEKALLGDEWGKSVPSRQADARRFRRIADSGSRTRFNALAAALDEIGARPPLALSCADGSRPYGVIWRTGRTAAGERIAFIASMNRRENALRLGGEWRELLKGRDVSGTFTLAPCEVLLLKGSRP